MADDRLPCCRSLSIAVTRCDKVFSRSFAISLSLFQNASSRLMLVLRPPTTIERCTIGDFMALVPTHFAPTHVAVRVNQAQWNLVPRPLQLGRKGRPRRDSCGTEKYH